MKIHEGVQWKVDRVSERKKYINKNILKYRDWEKEQKEKFGQLLGMDGPSPELPGEEDWGDSINKRIWQEHREEAVKYKEEQKEQQHILIDQDITGIEDRLKKAIKEAEESKSELEKAKNDPNLDEYYSALKDPNSAINRINSKNSSIPEINLLIGAKDDIIKKTFMENMEQIKKDWPNEEDHGYIQEWVGQYANKKWKEIMDRIEWDD